MAVNSALIGATTGMSGLLVNAMPPTLAATPLNVVLFGPPGAGKGTQADRFCARHGVPKISTGEILRQAIHDCSPLGEQVRERLARGKLIDDGRMIDVVRERLDQPDTAAGFVLDGFPRTVAQARALDRLMGGRGPLVVIALDVKPEILARRLSSRGRSDDEDAVVLERMKIYARDTAPVLDYYRQQGVMVLLDGDRSLDAVTEAINSAVLRARQTE